MKNKVIIKGNRYGISIVLDKEVEFSELIKDLIKRLENAEHFFDCDRQLVVAFEGRTLSNDELDQILAVIKENSKLNIQYVMDKNSELEATFYDVIYKNATFEEMRMTQQNSVEVAPIQEITSVNDYGVSDKSPNNIENTGVFYKGTLRSGQTLQSESSVVVIGDVNPGATILAGGNIIVIGTLKGSAMAGINGDLNAFVMALGMEPLQIQIAGIFAQNLDKRKRFKLKKETMIATVVDNRNCIEPIAKSSMQDISF